MMTGRLARWIAASVLCLVSLSGMAVVHTQAKGPVAIRVLADADGAEGTIEQVLETIGFEARRMDFVLPLGSAESEKIVDRLLALRSAARNEVAEALEGEPHRRWLVFLENGPQFGYELGFVELTEIQKHRLKQLQRERADRLAGHRRGKAASVLDRQYSAAVEKLLDDRQIGTLRRVQAARLGRGVPETMVEPDGRVKDFLDRLERVREGRARRRQVELITAVDTTRGTLSGLARLYISRVVYRPQSETIVVDGRLVDDDGLRPDRPVVVFYDSPDRVYPALVVQHGKGPMAVADGRLAAVKDGKVTLHNSVLGPLAVAREARLMRFDGTPIDKLVPDRYVKLALARENDKAPWQVVAALDVGTDDPGRRNLQGVLWSVDRRSASYGYLNVAGAGRGNISLKVADDFEVLDRRSGRVLTLEQLARTLAEGGFEMTVYESRPARKAPRKALLGIIPKR